MGNPQKSLTTTLFYKSVAFSTCIILLILVFLSIDSNFEPELDLIISANEGSISDLYLKTDNGFQLLAPKLNHLKGANTQCRVIFTLKTLDFNQLRFDPIYSTSESNYTCKIHQLSYKPFFFSRPIKINDVSYTSKYGEVTTTNEGITLFEIPPSTIDPQLLIRLTHNIGSQIDQCRRSHHIRKRLLLLSIIVLSLSLFHLLNLKIERF